MAVEPAEVGDGTGTITGAMDAPSRSESLMVQLWSDLRNKQPVPGKQLKDMSEEARPNSIKYLGEEFSRVDQMLVTQLGDLEAKLRTTLTLASALTVALGFAGASPIVAPAGLPNTHLSIGPLISWAALVVYSLAVVTCFLSVGFGMRFARYPFQPDPYRSWADFANKTEPQLDYLLAKKRAEQFPVTLVIVERKARWTSKAVWLLIVQILALAILLVSETFQGVAK